MHSFVSLMAFGDWPRWHGVQDLSSAIAAIESLIDLLKGSP